MTPLKARIIGATVATAASAAASLGSYYEGIFPMGYADPVGIPTDCIGDTNGAKVGVQRYTREQCIAMYDVRLQDNWNKLSNCIHVDVTFQQAAALMSFSDNTGIGATCGSTMVRMLNAGAPPNVWCAQMSQWNKARYLGQVITLPGLTKRRTSERAMCEGKPLDNNFQPIVET